MLSQNRTLDSHFRSELAAGGGRLGTKVATRRVTPTFVELSARSPSLVRSHSTHDTTMLPFSPLTGGIDLGVSPHFGALGSPDGGSGVAMRAMAARLQDHYLLLTTYSFTR